MRHLKILESFKDLYPKAVETDEGWKVTTSESTFERTGRRYWQKADNDNEYKDIIFKNEEDAKSFADEKIKIRKKHNI